MSIANLDDLKKSIDAFNRRFKGPEIAELKLTEPYDIVRDHPMKWPSAESKGVYCLLDDERNLLYIGKASWKSYIGNRLGAHLTSDSKKPWTSIDAKSKGARFIVTVPLADEHAFMASALEEWLVTELKPERNVIPRR